MYQSLIQTVDFQAPLLPNTQFVKIPVRGCPGRVCKPAYTVLGILELMIVTGNDPVQSRRIKPVQVVIFSKFQ